MKNEHDLGFRKFRAHAKSLFESMFPGQESWIWVRVKDGVVSVVMPVPDGLDLGVASRFGSELQSDKCLYDETGVLLFGFPDDVLNGWESRDVDPGPIPEELEAKPLRYGYCPICGAGGETRKNGHDRCRKGHVYISAKALS